MEDLQDQVVKYKGGGKTTTGQPPQRGLAVEDDEETYAIPVVKGGDPKSYKLDVEVEQNILKSGVDPNSP